MKNHWIELKCYDVIRIFTNVEFCSINSFNHLVNSNFIWGRYGFCCTIHHISSYYGIFGWIFFRTLSLADLGGAWGTHAPPGRPNSFDFMQFSGKFGVFTPPWRVHAPPRENPGSAIIYDTLLTPLLTNGCSLFLTESLKLSTRSIFKWW